MRGPRLWRHTRLWPTRTHSIIGRSMVIQMVNWSPNLALPCPRGSSTRKITSMFWEFMVFFLELCCRQLLVPGGIDLCSSLEIKFLSKPRVCLRYSLFPKLKSQTLKKEVLISKNFWKLKKTMKHFSTTFTKRPWWTDAGRWWSSPVLLSSSASTTRR